MIRKSGTSSHPARKRFSPEERAARKAERQAKEEARIRERLVNRVADAAILCRITPVNGSPDRNLDQTMNNGERIGDYGQRIPLVSLTPELLLSARNVLAGRSAVANESDAKVVGTKKELESTASTRSAALILQGAICVIDREMPKK
ncbi:MAG: hypothetical protein ACM3JF_01060 [Sphaerimonospora mesophila]